MGSTKKRRPTKHRGNAAGMVETRGRTGARNAPQSSNGASGPRVPQPASWKRAFLKALLPVVILLPVLYFTNTTASLAQILGLVAFAYLIYIPLSYYSDRWVYNRYLKRGA
ncbi:MAG: hypothetical protein JHD16_11070 [Solirubrobacteraceae bacterium]|nr:hypothetical protein [Solirubrobacteraceae bacterium]